MFWWVMLEFGYYMFIYEVMISSKSFVFMLFYFVWILGILLYEFGMWLYLYVVGYGKNLEMLLIWSMFLVNSMYDFNNFMSDMGWYFKFEI